MLDAANGLQERRRQLALARSELPTGPRMQQRHAAQRPASETGPAQRADARTRALQEATIGRKLTNEEIATARRR